ncbi:hypothetical protein C3L33_01077, partial [Rhododendron williamsianum]
MSALKTVDWQWQNAVAGSVAGLATVAFSHPLDVVRTRFQVSDGRTSNLPLYKNTPHALWTIARIEGLRGLYAGFYPAVLGSTISWGLYFFFYSKAKERYSKGREELTPGVFLHESPLARENKIAASDSSSPESAIFRALRHQFISDAVRTILKEEGWSALYKGLVPGLFLVTHGAIQFTAYEELRKAVVEFRSADSEEDSSAVELLVTLYFYYSINFDTNSKSVCESVMPQCVGSEVDVGIIACLLIILHLGGRRCQVHSVSLYSDDRTFYCISQNTIDYATLGASSKLAAILLTYPFQVIRSRLQQRPSKGGIPIYMDTWHVVKETARLALLKLALLLDIWAH